MDPICELQERATLARERRQFDAAERHLRRALSVLEQRGEGEHPDAANLACELADLLTALRRDAEAEALARRSLTIIEAALRDARAAELDPEDVQALERIRLAAWSALATALRGQGRYDDAEPFARSAAARSARLFGARSAETGRKLNDLGVLYKYAGAFDEAARVYARARASFERAAAVDAAADDASLGTVLYNLSGLAHARGEPERAEPLVRAALERLERAFGPTHPDLGAGHATLGAILQAQGRFDEAEQAYLRALEIVQAAYGMEHADVALVQANLSEIERARGHLERAEELAREALRLRRALLGNEHPMVASSLNNLALVLAERGRREEAVRLLAAAHALCVARCGADHPNARLFTRNLADVESSLAAEQR